MLSEFKTHLSTNFPFLENAKLLVACSGGLDSVVLSRLLHTLEYKTAIAHCNFSLRGSESDEDALFTKNLAEILQIPFHSETFDTETFAKDHKLSIQMAARELRYQWFEEVAQNFGYEYVLTAHHADDDLETFFINLSRGTGLRGLTGIPKQNEKVLRPLLSFSREAILTYAKNQNIYWREDSSNAKTDYLRNQLRIAVLPKFKDVSEKVLLNFQKTQQHLTSSQALIDDYMALVYTLVISETKEGYSLNIAKILELSNTEALLYELLHPFGFTAWDDIFKLLQAQAGKEVFSATHRLIKDRGVLLLNGITTKEYASFAISESISEIAIPLSITFENDRPFEITNAHTVFVDKELLEFPLTLRKWEEGDYFYPFGMQGKKKLSKFFKDEKVSLVAKENVWLLCSKNSIVWVVGYRLDDRFKRTPQTEKLLKISLHL
jgi:tRNA(Ile)-lysidine synthase